MLELLSKALYRWHLIDLVIEKIVQLCVLFVFVNSLRANEILVHLTFSVAAEDFELPSLSNLSRNFVISVLVGKVGNERVNVLAVVLLAFLDNRWNEPMQALEEICLQAPVAKSLKNATEFCDWLSVVVLQANLTFCKSWILPDTNWHIGPDELILLQYRVDFVLKVHLTICCVFKLAPADLISLIWPGHRFKGKALV